MSDEVQTTEITTDNSQGAGLLSEVARIGEENKAAAAADSWRTSLEGDELKSSKALDKFKSPLDLAKAYVNLEKQQGGALKPLAADATPEQKKEFWAKLGTPAKAEDYTVKRPDNLPEWMDYNEDLEKGWKEFAYSKNMPQEMMHAALDFWNEKVAPMMFQEPVSEEQAVATMKEQFGADYQKQYTNVVKAIKTYVPEELADVWDAKGISNDPAMLSFLARIGGMTSEDNAISTFGDRPQNQDNEALIAEKANMYQPGHAYRNSADPGHKAAVERMVEINRRLYPTK